MRALLPYLALYKRHKWMLTLGIVLAIVTLLASIGLLTLSGWFLSASAVAGLPGSTASTTCFRRRASAAPPLPVRQEGTSSDWSAMTRHSACCNICAFTPSVNCCPSPAGLARFRQGNCSTVWLRMSTPGSPLPARDFPIVGAFVVIVVVTLGLSVLDVPVALTLGGSCFDAHYPAAAILPRG